MSKGFYGSGSRTFGSRRSTPGSSGSSWSTLAPVDLAGLVQLNLPAFDAVVSTEVVEHVYIQHGNVLICFTLNHG